MNMNILEVVTPPYIYHGRSTRKMFWEEKITLGEFMLVNMKKYGCKNVSKHKYIKNGEKYIILAILLKFGSLEKIKITSSESKYYLGRSVKVLITSLGFNTIVRAKKKNQGMTLLMSV